MRYISLIFFILLPFLVSSMPAPESQVRVNGRVASFESVVIYCEGDTAAALSISIPISVSTPYYNRARVRAEKLYNTLNPAWICVGAAILCALLPEISVLSLLLMLLLCGEFAVRWWLGDGIPLTGLTDMAGCIAIGLSVLAFCGFGKKRILSLIIAVLMLFVALRGVHPAVRPVNPALQSGWLPFHVAMMAGAYSLFMVSAVCAIAGRVGKRVFRCISAGEICLASGIIIGSLWAADVWGSYWSWDPKETAALVTFLIYLALIFFWRQLHKRAHLMRGIIIAAFIAVLFTWVGVSGGMHSY